MKINEVMLTMMLLLGTLTGDVKPSTIIEDLKRELLGLSDEVLEYINNSKYSKIAIGMVGDAISELKKAIIEVFENQIK